MSVELWIDEVAKLFDGIRIGQKSIRSFRIYEKAEFPDSINGDQLPCALTYTTECRSEYGSAGAEEFWNGKTEVHWAAGADRSKYPEIMLLFKQVRNAFALHMQLGSKVAICLLDTSGPSMQGPVVFSYGEDPPHLGLLVNWTVKEIVGTEITIGL